MLQAESSRLPLCSLSRDEMAEIPPLSPRRSFGTLREEYGRDVGHRAQESSSHRFLRFFHQIQKPLTLRQTTVSPIALTKIR